MLLNTFSLAASLLSLSAAAAIKKRNTMSLYSYGGETFKLSVFYGDGLAWIGNVSSAPDWLGVTSDITFNMGGTTTPLTINSASSLWTDGAYELYIIPTTDAEDQVGFVATDGTAPTGAVTTGFYLFGSALSWENGDESEEQFWAVETNTTGLWKLIWNQADEATSDNTVVVLKDYLS